MAENNDGLMKGLMKDGLILVHLTCSSLVEAETILKELLQQRLIACGHVGTHVHSYYRWQGKEEDATEYPVTLKSSLACFAELESEVRRLHSYEVPELIAVPITAGSEDYLRWMKANLKNQPE